MTKAGDIIDSHSGVLSEWLEETLTVRNYVEGTADDYGDESPTLSSDSPHQASGRVELPDDPQQVSRASGETTIADAEILIDDAVPVSDGGDEFPFPSEIEDENGVVYEAAHVFDEGNGRLRVQAVDSEQGA
jgi:hypothetical protein